MRLEETIQCYVSQDMKEKLRGLSQTTRLPMATLVREALEDLLEKRKHQIPPKADPRQTQLFEP